MTSPPPDIAQLIPQEGPTPALLEGQDLGDGYWAVFTTPASPDDPTPPASYMTTPDQRVLLMPTGCSDAARLRLKGLLQEFGDTVDVGFLLQESLQAV